MCVTVNSKAVSESQVGGYFKLLLRVSFRNGNQTILNTGFKHLSQAFIAVGKESLTPHSQRPSTTPTSATTKRMHDTRHGQRPPGQLLQRLPKPPSMHCILIVNQLRCSIVPIGNHVVDQRKRCFVHTHAHTCGVHHITAHHHTHTHTCGVHHITAHHHTHTHTCGLHNITAHHHTHTHTHISTSTYSFTTRDTPT